MSEKPAHNAGDPESVKEQKRKAKLATDLQESDLRTLLGMAEFRRYCWRHWNETCGILRSSASANGSIQSQNIGMQDVARVLWAEIEGIDAKAIPQMMLEYQAAQQAQK